MLSADDEHPAAPAAITANSTDDEKFAYMLGAQFGGQNFTIIPRQMGEKIYEDALVQAIRDNVKANKDTNFKLQVSVDSLRRVGFDYMKRLYNAFNEYFKGEHILNMRYLEGTSQCMFVENMTDEEILELRQRDGNPDYDVIKQRRQSGIESIAYSYKDEYIETLKSQMTDLRIQINDNMKRELSY